MAKVRVQEGCGLHLVQGASRSWWRCSRETV